MNQPSDQVLIRRALLKVRAERKIMNMTDEQLQKFMARRERKAWHQDRMGGGETKVAKGG